MPWLGRHCEIVTSQCGSVVVLFNSFFNFQSARFQSLALILRWDHRSGGNLRDHLAPQDLVKDCEASAMFLVQVRPVVTPAGLVPGCQQQTGQRHPNVRPSSHLPRPEAAWHLPHTWIGPTLSSFFPLHFTTGDFFFFRNRIEIHFTQPKIHPPKNHSFVVFHIVTDLCNHHPYLILGRVYHP